ncbi:hypothetical protein JAAARDRAFT_28078 [Jaapia argillacea MUCL 33604]|uniref:Carbohydrate-binding module family 35 protein n=1 Tax=Jaapia argillacea MUCL 33604 TaxID=933084 RepID=A0A067QBM9_9AGAM|nr:hypothetical protein JAAARDRAFT_28078 [Jaapia argillacea MUCL 33604]
MTGSSLATMSRQLSLSLNLLSFLVIYSTLAACAQTNRTIDDQFGDQVTALVPVYSPATAWKQGANCTDCLVNPLVSQAFKGTWHQGLHTAGDVESTVVTVSFRGTAVYAYCVLANTISYSNTPTNLNFRLNNTIVGTFVHTPDASTTFIYNVPVYVNTSIPNGLHTFEIEATGNTSLVMFDYLTYTYVTPNFLMRWR